MPEGRKRDRKLSLWLDEEEAEQIRSAARLTGLALSDFIVARCVHGQTSFDLKCLPGSEADARPSPKRPTRNLGERKNRRLYIRCTEAERTRIAELAAEAGISVSDYVMACALGSRITKIEWGGEEELRRAYAELRRQGGNLNQIAYRVNRLASIAWRDDVSGSLIDQLVREVAEDNERTRAQINDAVRAIVGAIAAIRESRDVGRR